MSGVGGGIIMVDSPRGSGNRVLTRTDSMLLFSSPKGGVGFAYGFACASVLCMLFLVLNPSGYYVPPTRFSNNNSSSPTYHFAHFFTNNISSSSEPSHHNTSANVVNASTSHDKTSENSAKVNDHGSSQISRKEGSGLVKQKHIKKRKHHSPQNRTHLHRQDWRKLKDCDFYDGSWVRDDSYPLYKAGSCPLIDEPFNCMLNGRSDNFFEKFRWQPKNCNIPRLNGKDMLELLRGKRLVFVGDSLNRNMWESLVCALRNTVEDKSKVFEVSGREEFRTEGSYSFIFADYNCSIEFFRSPFLVQEWEIPDKKGSKKETLRLDLVERSCDKYKDADVLIFNTGHWWTHEKRTEGKEYYQEGDYIHGQLNVEEAFHKALLTWSRWVDTNVDPNKTKVFFRGYSPSHFRGAEWDSGGRCENDTEPMKNESDLSEQPSMMRTIESVVKEMKHPVFYLNITKMTDFRIDAHPSIYRNFNMTEETKRYMLKHQDCSHWCLPGVPDTWNELVYGHLLYSMDRNKANLQNKS
ncbi:hypothetical protein Lal_00047656 [Lupinus albus]|uniref:Putative PMR5 domain, PC-Esterase n=1 Tax=Lupinus albus TaxID=3870 RepID=A0A6A5MW13_LUPAL|nr:putative PMR5 domain, PC-Esterase [Lupinus albus]KAF1878984.1 hypothetical protein Lal_00047656 [Lupinus albus]